MQKRVEKSDFRVKRDGFDRSVFRTLTLISQFGINMIVPIVVCLFIGVFLDQKFDTSFWSIILFFVGALAGFNSVYKMAKRFYQNKSGDKYDRKD